MLNHYEINKPLISYHRHNEETKSEILIEKLRNGENIALVSDAGTPGICDPGEEVIKKAIEDQEKVIIYGDYDVDGITSISVLKKFLDSDIKEVRIFSRDEKKQDDMRHRLQNKKVKFYIGDVRDKDRLYRALEKEIRHIS